MFLFLFSFQDELLGCHQMGRIALYLNVAFSHLKCPVASSCIILKTAS